MKANHPVNTREPYRIDVHHHVLPEFFLKALDRMGKRTIFELRLPDWSLKAHLQVMDTRRSLILETKKQIG